MENSPIGISVVFGVLPGIKTESRSYPYGKLHAVGAERSLLCACPVAVLCKPYVGHLLSVVWTCRTVLRWVVRLGTVALGEG